MKAKFHAAIGRMSYPQIIALGYALLILIGTGLLCLPQASHGPTSALTALFTATSATCVTGLVVVDTLRNWTLFGQAIILLLIQVGGLGFVTILTMFSMFLRKRIGLRARSVLKESANSLYIGGIVRLYRHILFGTAAIEGIGAALLATRFIPRYGFARGLWYSVFHSISAFCNAGFDLMGEKTPYSSLVPWAADPVVCLTIGALIIVGGIGFFVWEDLCVNRLHWKKYQLHTKITLSATAVLVFGGMVLFWLFERHNTLAGMPMWQQWLDALFSSITPRTAGFNVVDYTRVGGSAKLLTIVFMVIGGSSGGTAGGIKTSTITVLLWCTWGSLRGQKAEEIFGRRFEHGTLRRANAVATVYLLLLAVGCFSISALHPEMLLENVVFEAASAIGTVGLSASVTATAGVMGRWILVLLMYTGRVGSLSFALLFTDRKQPAVLTRPTEKISIG